MYSYLYINPYIAKFKPAYMYMSSIIYISTRIGVVTVQSSVSFSPYS